MVSLIIILIWIIAIRVMAHYEYWSFVDRCRTRYIEQQKRRNERSLYDRSTAMNWYEYTVNGELYDARDDIDRCDSIGYIGNAEILCVECGQPSFCQDGAPNDYTFYHLEQSGEPQYCGCCFRNVIEVYLGVK